MIVLDGSNGAGKSTVIKAVKEYIESRQLEVVMTREPGGTPIGEKLRNIILSKEHPEMDDLTELMLFGAGRAQHLAEKIYPALESGKVVLSDRFDSATISFQHFARGIDRELVDKINNLALNGFSPTLTIILDLDPRIGLDRVRSRGEGLDRLEDQDLLFLDRARNGYLRQAEEFPNKFYVIDASQSLEKVISEAILAVEQLL